MRSYLFTLFNLLACSILVTTLQADTIIEIRAPLLDTDEIVADSSYTIQDSLLSAEEIAKTYLIDDTDSTEEVAADRPVVYAFSLDDDIMQRALFNLTNALNAAKDTNADYIIMTLNTYGGRVDIADSMRTMLLDVEATMVVLVKDNAISAGALISIACDSIYMSKGSSMGAATVVSGEDGQAMPDKYQSFMRAKMRATAEANGRDPRIAEAMVDDRIYIEGIIDSGYTLTFSAEEAIKHGYSEGYAESVKEVIEKLGIADDYVLVNHKESGVDAVMNFFLHPFVSGILMMIIVLGIMFELKTPGVGFPIMAAAIAAVFYFAPLYIEGLAAYWEIAIFVVGVVLLMVELFAIPGFGVAGISGIVLMIGGLTLALINNINFDFSFTAPTQIFWALMRVVLSLGIGFTLILMFGGSIIRSRAFQRRVMLMDTQEVTAGYTSVDTHLSALIGKEGIAINELRPAGTVEIDGERYDAVSDGAYIVRGSKVKVIKIPSSSSLVVKLVKEG